MKLGTQAVFGKFVEEGVKASRKVAGEAAVKSGENKVAESIIKGTTDMWNKLFDRSRKN